jgi:hypothetical protein
VLGIDTPAPQGAAWRLLRAVAVTRSWTASDAAREPLTQARFTSVRCS